MLTASSSFCADFDGKKDEWLFIPISVPEGKIGGGDFYNLKAEPDDRDFNNFQSRTEKGGIAIRSQKSGEYGIQLIINHISKSSCAAVEVSEYQRKHLSLFISE
jgi:hypothetical protein